MPSAPQLPTVLDGVPWTGIRSTAAYGIEPTGWTPPMHTLPILLAALALAAAIPANAEPGASPPAPSAATTPARTDGSVDPVALYKSWVAEAERKMTVIEDRLYQEYLDDAGTLSREAWKAAMTGRSNPRADRRDRNAPDFDDMCRPGRRTDCSPAAWAWQFKSTSPEWTKP